MRTRSTILGVLVSGIVLSSSGAALGISALAAGDSASQAQYPGATVPTETTSVVPTQSTTPTPPAGGNGPDKAVERPSVHGATETNDSAPGTATAETAPVAQPTEQVALDNKGELPFTGYAAIPVLLLGLALLGAGLVMRRRSNADLG